MDSRQNEKACGSPLAETISQIQKRLEAKPDADGKPVDQYEERMRAMRVTERYGRLKDQLGPRYSYELTKLEKFQCYTAEQKKVVADLTDLIEKIPSLVAAGRGLVFYGSVGTGKDHLMAAMLYQGVRQGLDCRWVNGQEIYGRFRDSMDDGTREADILREMCGPDILGISDPIPPAADPSPYNLQQLYRLMDRRYRGMGSTWVSLNALSPEDADAKLSAPIFDRLRDGAVMLRCFWPSFRERPMGKA